MKLKSILAMVLLGVSFCSLQPMARVTRTASAAIENVSSLYGLHWTSTFMHEMGHKMGFKMLFNIPSKLEIFSLFPDVCMAMIPEENLNEDSIAASITAVAGPVTGILSTLALLKINNVVIQLRKGKTFKQAVIQGLKQPFFNREQNWGIQVGAIANFISNLVCLIPVEGPYTGTSDGYRVLRGLGIKYKVNKS